MCGNLIDESKSFPRNLTYKQVYNIALEMFQYNKDKTNSWWMTKTEELGGLSPYQMVKNGKGRQLIRLLEKCK